MRYSDDLVGRKSETTIPLVLRPSLRGVIMLAMLLVTALASSFLSVPAVQASSGSGEIAGVIHGADGLPLEGHRISLERFNGENEVGSSFELVVEQEATNSDGSYLFSGLTEGQYRLIIYSGNNHYFQYFPEIDSEENGDLITVSDGLIQLPVITLEPWSTIEGTVLGADSLPLQGSLVTAVVLTAGGVFDGHSHWGYTDVDGNYAIPVPEGNYTLQVEAGNGHMGEYYEGKQVRQSAEVLTVERNQAFSVPDWRLQTGATISGAVSTSDGSDARWQVALFRQGDSGIKYGKSRGRYYGFTPDAGWTDVSYRVGSDERSESPYDETKNSYVKDSNFEYSFTGLAPGNYKLWVADFSTVNEEQSPEGLFYQNRENFAEAEIITVTGTESIMLNEMSITTSPSPSGSSGSLVSTVVDAATSVGIQNVTVQLFTPYGGSDWQLSAVRTTDGDGVFGFSNLPDGEYRLGFVKEGYAESFYLGASSLASAQTLTVSGGVVPTLSDIGLNATPVPDEPVVPVPPSVPPVVSDPVVTSPPAPAPITTPAPVPTLPAPATTPVRKVSASLSTVKAPKSVKRGKKAKVSLTVKSSKATRGATVTVKLGKKTVAKPKVTAKGKVSFTINTKKLKLKKGKTYSFKVQYQGNSVTNKSKTKTVKIKVK